MMRAVGIGTLALDVTRYDGVELQRAGGSCTNILLHLASMGWDCVMCHMDGNDEIAEYLKKDLKNGGVESVSLKHEVPSYVLVINSKNGRHTYQRMCEHEKQITTCKVVVPSLEERLNPECDVFVFDKAWDTAARFAHRTNGIKWFETYRHGSDNMVWKECVGVADIIKTADNVCVPDGVDRVVTHETDGLEYHYNGIEGRINAVMAPQMADTCGCGDCVSACCIDAICNGQSAEYGLKRGVRLAALNCCYPGPRCMLDSTTKEYRNGIMDGKPIEDLPKAVYNGASFDICSCGKT